MNHNPDSRIHILWCQIYSEWPHVDSHFHALRTSESEPKCGDRGEVWGDPFIEVFDPRVSTIRFENLKAFPLQRTQVRGQKLESMLRKLLKHIRRENGRK